MLQVEIIHTDKKTLAGICAIVDIGNPDELRTILTSICEQHKEVMRSKGRMNESVELKPKKEPEKINP